MTNDQLDPMAVHRGNNKALMGWDVLMPAYPGSGHAFLGNVMLELGLNYSDPYTELFDAAGWSTPLPEREVYRRRLAATAAIDEANSRPAALSPRFVKTHLYPSDFDAQARGIVLLVRDPRDAIYSYYNWRLGFSEEGERATFEEFLDRPGPNGVPPTVDWAQFYNSWLARRAEVESLEILRFEDLKQHGPGALEPLLRKFAAHVDRATVSPAFDASTFEVMRSHEDRQCVGAGERRIMRRGRVGEWRDWFSSRLRPYFEDPLVRQTASSFGYIEWPGESER